MKMNIGANIKRLRVAKNITQEQLSEAMNVTCVAVSKWERGETFPDITLLQPLAYFFNITLDELMGYDKEKIEKDIEDILELYTEHKNSNFKKAREIITKAYHDYPNDYRIMHAYMWNIGGGMADNDPKVLIEHKDEFLSICLKILEGCTDDSIRIEAWNMRAKLFHAEGKTEEALKIYNTKFANWYKTYEQKTEQLFSKDTEEYYFHVQKNMYELTAFAGDKLGRVIFFDRSTDMSEKEEKAVEYGKLMIDAFEKTGDVVFAVYAEAFLSRIRNDFTYRGGSDESIIALMDNQLYASKVISEAMKTNEPLRQAFWMDSRSKDKETFLKWILDYHLTAKHGRRAELLNNPSFVKVLNKYV